MTNINVNLKDFGLMVLIGVTLAVVLSGFELFLYDDNIIIYPAINLTFFLVFVNFGTPFAFYFWRNNVDAKTAILVIFFFSIIASLLQAIYLGFYPNPSYDCPPDALCSIMLLIIPYVLRLTAAGSILFSAIIGLLVYSVSYLIRKFKFR